jgi:hypothetical protein
MDYAKARLCIASGDTLLIEGHNAFSAVTRGVQCMGGLGEHAAVTHVGVAWWMADALWCVEMDGKHNVARRLSQHLTLGCRVTVAAPPVAVDGLQRTFDQATTTPIRYGILDLGLIGARLVLGVGERTESDGDLVCSTFVTRWWHWAGWQRPDGFALRPAPCEVAKYLAESGRVKFVLDPGSAV